MLNRSGYDAIRADLRTSVHSIGKGRAGQARDSADSRGGAKRRGGRRGWAGLLRAWRKAKPGYRNGYRTRRLKTVEGAMEYSAPQIAGRDEPFRSAIGEHLKGHTQGLEDLAIEMLARALP
jgi:hypothetical protein